MADKAISVLDRLKRISRETGRNYNLCLQLFCQEEFLRRLENSKYAENFVLKGGLFIYSITGFDGRVTHDIDFLMKSLPNTPEKLKPILEEIINTKTENDFMQFELIKIESIAEQKEYAGIGATFVVRMKNTRTPFSIDFGVGDVIVPKSEKRMIPTQLKDFKSPCINTYSIETTIAEKIDAILDLMETSSRMKDYYDIYYLGNKYNFEGELLKEALKRTFDNRKHNFDSDLFERLLTFDSDEIMQRKWKAFLRKIKVSNIDFGEVINFIDKFLSEPFSAAIEGKVLNKSWTAETLSWK